MRRSRPSRDPAHAQAEWGKPAGAPASPGDPEDGTARGILFVLIAMFAISVNDTTIKFLSDAYPLHQMVFVRSAIGIAISFVLLRLEGGLALLRTATPGLHALRAGLIVLANMLFFAALAVLPLAEATALFFIAPLVITLLSIPVLGERVGPRRIAAILVGLAGVLVILGIGTGERATDGDGTALPIWALALPLLAACCYAGMQVLTRKLGVASRASAMAIYIQGSFLLVSAAFFVTVGDGRLEALTDNVALRFLLRAWVWPPMEDWPLFLVLGLASGAIGYCLSNAYRLGAPATIASYEYVVLPLAIFWGWAIWGEVPGLRTLAGIVLICGAGLYVFLRERQRARALASARPQRRV